jgi:hypothetical protein
MRCVICVVLLVVIWSRPASSREEGELWVGVAAVVGVDTDGAFNAGNPQDKVDFGLDVSRELRVSYAFSKRWVGRAVLSSGDISVRRGLADSKLVAGDLVYYITERSVSTYAFTRVGMRSLRWSDPGTPGESNTWSSMLLGLGVGIEYPIIPRFTMQHEAYVSYVRVSDLTTRRVGYGATEHLIQKNGAAWSLTLLSALFRIH